MRTEKIVTYCRNCGETSPKWTWSGKCTRCGRGMYFYEEERDAEKLALAQEGKLTPEMQERDKREARRGFLKIFLPMVVLIIIGGVVIAGLFTVPSPKEVKLAVENTSNTEVKFWLYVDGISQGWDYISPGESDYYRYEGYDPDETHIVGIATSSPFWTEAETTLPAGKSVTFVIHQDGAITYFFW